MAVKIGFIRNARSEKMVYSPIQGTLRSLILLSIVAVLISGCSFAPIVSHQSIAYNKSYDTEFNEQMLLNIVRASTGRPLRFTRLASVTQAIKAQANLSGSESFSLQNTTGIPGRAVLGQALELSGAMISGSGNVSTGPTFNVNPIETQDFYKGILNQVNVDVFKLFFESQLPQSIVSALLIDRIDIKVDDGRRCSIRNDPRVLEDQADFEVLIADLISRAPSIRKIPNERKVIARNIPISDISLVGIAKLEEAGLNIKFNDANNTLSVRNKASFRYEVYLERGNRVLASIEGSDAIEGQITPASTCRQRGIKVDLDSPRQKISDVKLRSVDGVFHYLGKVIQSQLSDPPNIATAQEGISNARVPILLVEINSSDGSQVKVGYRGSIYSIPDQESYSMTSLALLSQLFYLNLAAETLQPSSTVLIAN